MVSGASGMGSRRGVSRRSLRLISAMRSVAPCVIVTFFAFGGFCQPYRSCGCFDAPVFSFAVWCWVCLCAVVSCLRFVILVLTIVLKGRENVARSAKLVSFAYCV